MPTEANPSRRQDLVIGGIILAGFFLFVLLLVSVYLFLMKDSEISSGGPKIAVIELIGPIYGHRDIVRQFKKYAEDEDISAILFRIDSPGGGVAASQEIYTEVKRAKKSGKIVVASMGTVAASGGYYVACAADTIVANPGSITGSIGVIIGIPNYARLLRKIGVGMSTVKSGSRKDTGSPYRAFTPEDSTYLQSIVDDVYGQFIDVVTRERGLDSTTVRTLATGRVFTGSQALTLGLVDVLGSYEEALELAAEMAGISGKPKIVRERRRRTSLFDFLFSDMEDAIARLSTFPVLEYRWR